MITGYLTQEETRNSLFTEESAEQIKILVIDDNRDFTNILNSLFKHMDYQSFAAYDEKHALEKMDKINPDLVFCDIGLPNRGAYRIANKIRSDCALYHIFLVALTYYTKEKIKLMTLDVGYDFYVSKPIQAPILRDIFDMAEIRKMVYSRQKSLINAG